MILILSNNESSEKNVSQLVLMLKERDDNLKKVQEMIENVGALRRLDLLKEKDREKPEIRLNKNVIDVIECSRCV